ncbi:MAG: serine/threonine-protein kinase [Verrucomicrobiales bacterium]
MDAPESPVAPPEEALSAEALDALLPDFEVGSIIAHGGMGTVYRALQPRLDRTVAIKVLAETRGEGGDDFAEKFAHEAKAMAKLQHTNIVTIYDFGEAPGGRLYIVMECVDGPTLYQMLQKGPLPEPQALALASQLCDGIGYAHERGVFHRDIKPANILVSPEGVAKLTDFGLAGLRHGAESDTGGWGTPGYAAPEVMVFGAAVDHRADLYSVGAVLYESLTGRLAAEGWEAPSRLAGTDPRIDTVLQKALNANPALRFSGAAELKAAIDRIRAAPRKPGTRAATVAAAMTRTPQRTPPPAIGAAPPRRSAVPAPVSTGEVPSVPVPTPAPAPSRPVVAAGSGRRVAPRRLPVAPSPQDKTPIIVVCVAAAITAIIVLIVALSGKSDKPVKPPEERPPEERFGIPH